MVKEHGLRRKERDNQKSQKCSHCYFLGSNRIMAKHYINEHPGEYIFKCNDCEYGSLWLPNIKKHNDAIHQKLNSSVNYANSILVGLPHN